MLADRTRLEELFACLRLEDQVLRMRAGDALEKVCRQRPEWLAPEAERILHDVGAVDQPSVQWHVAQILGHVKAWLSADQAVRATRLLQHNLVTSGDWIVLNTTMDVLTAWARGDPALAAWLAPHLERPACAGRRWPSAPPSAARSSRRDRVEADAMSARRAQW